MSKVTQFLLTLLHWDLSYLIIPFQLVLLTKITWNSGLEADTRQASGNAQWWYFCGQFCLPMRNTNSQFWLLQNHKASGQSIGSSSWLQGSPQWDHCWLFLLRAMVCNIFWSMNVYRKWCILWTISLGKNTHGHATQNFAHNFLKF